MTVKTTKVSNLICYLYLRLLVSVINKQLFSPLIFLLIFTNYTFPLEIPLFFLITQVLWRIINSFKWLYLKFINYKKKQPTSPLRPITVNTANPSCITATAGTGICQDFLPLISVIILINRKNFTTNAFFIRKTFLNQT